MEVSVIEGVRCRRFHCNMVLCSIQLCGLNIFCYLDPESIADLLLYHQEYTCIIGKGEYPTLYTAVQTHCGKLN